jgi:hypothetical protein
MTDVDVGSSALLDVFSEKDMISGKQSSTDGGEHECR